MGRRRGEGLKGSPMQFDATVDALRKVLEPFAAVYDWMIRNGHDPAEIDFLVRGPKGEIMGHLQVQSRDFKEAREALSSLEH
jgi:hypothetical protein